MTLEQRVSHIEGKLNSVATKEDVANLRVELTDRIGNLQMEMANQRAENKEMETRIIKWMVGTVLAGMALASSLTIALQNLL